MQDYRKSDRRLVAEWQAGRRREEISEILVQRYAGNITRFFRRQGFLDEACYDLTQEVLMRAFRALPHFEVRSSLATWLYEIARNVAKNTIRLRQTQKRLASEEISLETLADQPSSLPEPSHSAGPLDHVLVAEEHRLMRDAVAQLPPDLQRLLICQVHAGLRVSEIAVLLKIPEGTVKSRLSKARSLLRRKLKHLAPSGQR